MTRLLYLRLLVARLLVRATCRARGHHEERLGATVARCRRCRVLYRVPHRVPIAIIRMRSPKELLRDPGLE